MLWKMLYSYLRKTSRHQSSQQVSSLAGAPLLERYYGRRGAKKAKLYMRLSGRSRVRDVDTRLE